MGFVGDPPIGYHGLWRQGPDCVRLIPGAQSVRSGFRRRPMYRFRAGPTYEYSAVMKNAWGEVVWTGRTDYDWPSDAKTEADAALDMLVTNAGLGDWGFFRGVVIASVLAGHPGIAHPVDDYRFPRRPWR